jgi:hypothetical protein
VVAKRMFGLDREQTCMRYLIREDITGRWRSSTNESAPVLQQIEVRRRPKAEYNHSNVIESHDKYNKLLGVLDSFADKEYQSRCRGARASGPSQIWHSPQPHVNDVWEITIADLSSKLYCRTRLFIDIKLVLEFCAGAVHQPKSEALYCVELKRCHRCGFFTWLFCETRFFV